MNYTWMLENLRLMSLMKIVAPRNLKTSLAMSDAMCETVIRSRETVRAIMQRRDPRLLVIVGPCSIHDPDAALDYARRLAALADAVKDRLFVVMRAYFEKPRTTVGWKGFINDPHLDNSFDMDYGLHAARKLLIDIIELGLPVATEFLDPFIPQYLGDLVSWAAIGARTAESQVHREMISGLSMPVGIKNATSGDIRIAVDALLASRSSHSFLGIDQGGHISLVKTTGNPDASLVLRGGGGRPNYQPEHIAAAAAALRAENLTPGVIVDCSHANSGKQAERQTEVWDSVIAQRSRPDSPIFGVMLESFLKSGNQPIGAAPEYGRSITDPCLDWETTRQLLTYQRSPTRNDKIFLPVPS